jgi:signal transduction histidine kinase
MEVTSSNSDVSGQWEPPRAKILLVDDVPANLVALEAVLEPLGQTLVRAQSGEEALRHLLQDEYAVILMDVQMPGLDGLETVALIKARERCRHIPVIFITALSRELAYIVKGYAQGAVDYLLKPVDADILRTKVSVFVDLYQRGEMLKHQAMELSERRRIEAEIAAAVEFQQRLVGIVGHDIRSPLSALLATAKMLLSMGELTERQAKAIERIARSGGRIESIVRVLLDFASARIGGGIQIHREQTDLQALVPRALEELQQSHPERPIHYSHEGDAHGEWDADRLMQVLVNLLDNALKYSQEGTPVAVSTHGVEDIVVLEVHNIGEPIADSMVPILFEPFRRGVQSEQTQKMSLGLGLYIVKEIVRAHGGTIDVHSSRELGTTFRVRLPRWA